MTNEDKLKKMKNIERTNGPGEMIPDGYEEKPMKTEYIIEWYWTK